MSEENTQTMADFEEEIARSFHKIKEGDLVTCTVLSISDKDVLVDIGSYSEGLIAFSEISNDPGFNPRTDVTVGDQWQAIVLQEDDGNGSVLLSKKQANDLVAWKTLRENMDAGTIYSVKLVEAVNAGLIGYVEGIRAFIPASQLSLHYVEDLDSWVNKTVEAIIITADEEKHKLVISAKEVLKEKAAKDQEDKLSHLQKGLVTTGKIEKIAPYGAFVSIGENLTGLVHISQICGKHIKSPNEVVKIGDEVKVKILDVNIPEGRISLSMKAVEDITETVDNVEDAPVEYVSDENAGTSLGSLLSKFNL